MDKDVVYYTAGPMSGIKSFNIPAFDEAARRLRGNGYHIVSPAELDDPITRTVCLASPDGKPNPTAHGGTWGDFLARDVKLIADRIGGIILMPGWVTSRGARLEAFVGLLTGKVFAIYEQSGEPMPVEADFVRRRIAEHMP